MVSILIINWNGKKFLSACITAIADEVTTPHEIILVDNNSADGSADFVAANYPTVRLIRSKENLGFIRGTNLAAIHAVGDHLLLLNNDTILQTDIADAVSAFGDLRIGVVGALMFGGDGRPRISSARFPSPGRLWRFASMLYKTEEPFQSSSHIPLNRCDWVEGSFLMTPRDRWLEVGGLDTANFMYGDDFDYCRAILELGFVTVQCQSIRYTHFGGYDHSKMGYIFAGYRRYHRKFSKRRIQIEVDFVLRVGLLLRLPWYWLRANLRKDSTSRSALLSALDLNRNWSKTLVDAHRYHS
jgi:GT2 family glycosyltransferase